MNTYPCAELNNTTTALIGASLSEPHMGSKSVPRELSIYLPIYLCMRTSFRKCPHALIHRTVQFCRVCITSYHTKTMDPDTTIPVRDYSSKKEEQLLRRRVRERARRAAETAEEKAQRLSKRRARDKARRAAQRDEQHAEQRKTMLQQLRRQQQERRDAESSKQREDRLQHMRDQDHQRRDVESSEQRENRLQHMRDQEHQRRDVESSEQRENRLQHMRDQEHERRDAEDLAHALEWLTMNNVYYRNVSIDHDVLALLPDDGHLSGLVTMAVESDELEPPAAHQDIPS